MKTVSAAIALTLCLSASLAAAQALPAPARSPSTTADPDGWGTPTPAASASAAAPPSTAAAPSTAAPPPAAAAATDAAPIDTKSPDSPYYVQPPNPDYSEWMDQRKTKRRSTGMLIGGAILSGLGGIGFIAGLADYLLAESACTTLSSPSFDRGSCIDTYHVIGAAGMVAGGLMLAIGVPLAVVGSRKVPVAPDASVPELRIGAGGASLRWTF